jgi:cell division septation protein DedD
MDNITNNGASTASGASSGGNLTNNANPSSFGNGDNNPKPLPSYMGGSSQISDILKEASHSHDSIGGITSSASAADNTPAFSGMPHAGGSVNMSHTSNASHISTSAPIPTPAIAPTPSSVTPTPAVTHTLSSHTYSNTQGATGTSPFASTIAKQTMADYKDSQKKIAASGSGSYSHIYVWSILSILVLAIIGGGIYWYLFMGGKDMLFPTSTDINQVDNTPIKPATPSPVNPLPTTPKPVTTTPTAPVRPVVDGPFSGSEKDLVSQYIRKNINTLSPRKSAIGFTVSDIIFDGPNRAIVSYGNRSVSYSAVVNATVTNGVVRVTSFTILEK